MALRMTTILFIKRMKMKNMGNYLEMTTIQYSQILGK